MGLYGAMQLNGKRISGYQLVVKPLLGDPQGTDPIVYPTKPQFPHMHCSWTQRIVDWKEKLQIRFEVLSLFPLGIGSVGKDDAEAEVEHGDDDGTLPYKALHELKKKQEPEEKEEEQEQEETTEQQEKP
ncbi:GL25469 [Drosophila persimilis]|uniref:GL25469 n=1 Tax=Drosophila persimilis TaxID=7234 RepID=B4GU77_DROPE|nr:GL25469 [Drosophila persimilis]